MSSGQKFQILAALFFLTAMAATAIAGQYTGTIEVDPSDLAFTETEDGVIPHFPSSWSDGLPGDPMLPHITLNVAVPDGANDFDLQSTIIEEIDLEGVYHVLPVSIPLVRSDPLSEMVRPVKGRGFTLPVFPEETLKFSGTYDLAGQQVVILEFSPLRYEPASGLLSILEEVEYTIEWHDTGEQLPSPNFSERSRRLFESSLVESVVNPDAVLVEEGGIYAGGNGDIDLPAGNYEHVIIATSAMVSGYQELVQWHYEKGVTDTVVTIEWINSNYGGAEPDEIRSFTRDAHNQWGTTWLLVGGDCELIEPKYRTYSGDSIPSDVYYGDFDDDWKYEVYVGRAPVDDHEQLATFLSKVLGYEKNPPMTNFGKEVFFMGFDLDNWTEDEDLKKRINNEYVPSSLKPIDTVYDSHSGNHHDNALAYLQAGPNLVNHSDHSNIVSLGTGLVNHGWNLNIPEMLALTNGDKIFTFVSTGCLALYYDTDDCIGEGIVMNPDGGGLAFIGNTRLGWYFVGDTWNSLSAKYDRAFWHSFFVQGHTSVGEAHCDSKNDYYPSTTTNKYIWWELNLMGEPETPLWTDNPSTFTVTHDSQIEGGYQSYQVNVKKGGSNVSNAYVCAYQQGNVFSRGYTNSSGNVTLAISPAEGQMTLTVTKYNYKPYQGTVTVGPGGGPSLSITLTPVSTVIVKPGRLEFDIFIENLTGGSVSFNGWTEVYLPGGEPYAGNPMLGPASLSLGAYETFSYSTYHDISGTVPNGTYNYTAKVGTYPGTIIAQDDFDFTITD